MSLVPPNQVPTVVSPLRAFPYGIGTFPNTVPFTYRDGSTFSEMFEQWIQWVELDVVPTIIAAENTSVDAYNAASLALKNAMDDYTEKIGVDRAAFEATVTATLAKMTADISVALTTMRGEIADNVDAMTAARTAAETARDLAQQWAANTQVLQDTAVMNLLNDPASLARKAANSHFPVRGEQVYNVRDFGAIGDNVADDTDAVNAAIAEAAAFDSGTGATVYFPQGDYAVSNVGAKKGVRILGAGRDRTTIRAIPGTGTLGLVTFDPMYTDHFWIDDIALIGAGDANPNQSGVYAYARNATADSSGWGNGGMRRSRVQGFAKHPIWLRGGGGVNGAVSRELSQHQFLVFEHVDFLVDKTKPNSNAARISGKNGQITWINCQFNTSGGTSANPGINLNMIQEEDDNGNFLSDSNSYAHTFVNCSIEGREFGANLIGVFNISFVGTYFEVIGKAFHSGGGARGINAIGTHWATTHMSDNSGYLAHGESGSFINVFGGAALGVTDQSWKSAVNASGVIFGGDAPPSVDVTAQLAINAGGSLNTQSYRTVVVNAPDSLGKIVSNMSTGESLFMRALGGDISVVAGQIELAGRNSPAVIPAGHIAHFVKMDLTANWILVSIS